MDQRLWMSLLTAISSPMTAVAQSYKPRRRGGSSHGSWVTSGTAPERGTDVKPLHVSREDNDVVDKKEHPVSSAGGP